MTGIRSLAWATDIDVLPPDARVERRGGYWTVRSPSNPAHYWGNFLLFDDPPQAGDRARWEAHFVAEFGGGASGGGHRAFAWDRTDGELGAAEAEFAAAGYTLESTVGLIAAPAEIAPHPRASRQVVVRALDPAPGADADRWAQVVELWVAGRDPSHSEATYRSFSDGRLADLRRLFRLGRGAWWVAEPEPGIVVACLGIVVTGCRARFQTVLTAAAQRGRGICSRLVVEAVERTAERHRVESFVICADPGYHALGLYESLGFRPLERVTAVLQRPAGSSS